MRCTRAVWLVAILGIIFLGAAAPRAQATNLSQVKQIAAGGSHTCALLATGTVWCWGLNNKGQLGDGTDKNSSTPVEVANLTDAVAIAAGTGHTCAVLSDGRVLCWGWNHRGQLGDGTDKDSSTPVEVVNVTNAVAIAAGGYHSCALLADGRVKCWGLNYSGQSGDTTGNNGSAPELVKSSGGGDLTGAVAIAAGYYHTCALLATGTVWCWGPNFYGQLGNPNPGFSSATPVQATYSDSTPLHNIAAIAAGGNHTCALRWDGTVWCWGWNDYGQVGEGSGQSVSRAQQVSGLSNASAIAAGGYHTCAVLADGTASCWGDNSYGELGPNAGSASQTPVQVTNGYATALHTVVAISAGGAPGGAHTCAVLADGTASCWGDNSYGQLGNGDPNGASSSIPVAVIGGPNPGATDVSAGDYHSCAVLGDGTVKCWGSNQYGQLGNGSPDDSSTPVAVSGLSNVVAIAAGGYHTCALLGDGTVWCWGLNNQGQLGNGTSGSGTDSSTPAAVSGLSNVVAIAAANYHTCALLATGTVWCWGDNLNGQLGQLGSGSISNSPTPVQVGGLSNVVAIAAGGYHTCALLADGTVRCWGNNSYGQLGNGTVTSRSSATTVKNLINAVAIAAGNFHTCAVLTTGKVWCWGRNYDGELGDGTDKNSSTPVEVANVSHAVGIAVGGDPDYRSGSVIGIGHTCALLADGKAKCWGANTYGQLGDGRTMRRKTPIDVTGLTGAVAITAGGYHTCALLATGTVQCWGRNDYGEMGNGTVGGYNTTPVSTSPLFP